MRIFAAILALALVLLQYRLWVSDQGYARSWRLRPRSTRNPPRISNSASATASSPPKCTNLKVGLAALGGACAQRTRHGRQQRDVLPSRDARDAGAAGAAAPITARRAMSRAPADRRACGRSCPPRAAANASRRRRPRPSNTPALRGRTMIEWSLPRLLAEPRIEAIVVVVARRRCVLGPRSPRRSPARGYRPRSAARAGRISVLNGLAAPARQGRRRKIGCWCTMRRGPA